MQRPTTAVALALFAAGCSSSPRQGPELTGSAAAAVTLAPRNVACIVIAVTGGGTTVTSQYDVAPETSTVFDVNGLPLGADTFVATAYGVACASVGSASGTSTLPPTTGGGGGPASPTWVSDPVTATVAVGTPVPVTLEMHAANVPDSGSATVGVDFPGSTSNVVTEFQVGPVPALQMSCPIATGPDGNLWFAAIQDGVVGMLLERITPSGAATHFAALPASAPDAVAAGPDGNIWFTSGTGFGRVTPGGAITQFPGGGAILGALAAGADGDLWMLEWSPTPAVVRTTIGGTRSLFPVGVPGTNRLSSSMGIAAGPDGNLWFVDNGTNSIGRITMSGTVTEFAVPSPIGLGGGSGSPLIAAGMAQGPDGNLWFRESAGLGRISTDGTITEFEVPTANGIVAGVAAGPDGNVWFTEWQANQIGRITPSGTVTEFPLESPASRPCGITNGPDGNLWFTQPGTGQIGRITP